MKRFLTILAAIFITTTLFAQSPDKMSFQAVVRDNNNNLIVNSKVGIRISILQNSIPVYFETQTPATNANGLISIEIGEGSGFNTIDWGNGPYFIKTEIDPTGGKNYTITGTSQLMSVPYAFHSKTANYLVGQDNLRLKSADPGVGAQSWSQFGNAKTNPSKDKLGTTDPADMVFVTSNIERLRIKSDGKINLGFLEVGDDLTVKKNVYLNTVSGGTTNSGTLTVGRTLTVDGVTDLNSDLTVGGVTNLDDDLNVNKGNPTYLTGNLTVNGNTSMAGKASMGGGADFTGAVDFKDNVSINNGLTVSGTASVGGKATLAATDFSGQVTISSTVTGADSNFDAYPLRVQGGKQGIAIKVQGNRTTANNFVTFWDGDKIQGRIEGETVTEMLSDPETIAQNAFYTADLVLGGLDVFFAGWEFVQAIADLAAACSSTTGCAGVGAVVCAPIPSLIVAATANLVLKTAVGVATIAREIVTIADVATYNGLKLSQIGVTYQSGAGDYAEWLQKADPTYDFIPGQVIGVKSGKISLNTTDADHVLVVSSKPIVLGNMPEPGTESKYEKIAFMGQVHVKVPIDEIIKSGDYILASGNNDGLGKAVSPEDMITNDYHQIVGVAWSPNIEGIANVAVGLNTNDMVTKVTAQAKEITDLKAIFNQVVAVLKNYDTKLAVSLANIKTDPIDPGNGNGGERTIKYFKPKKEQLEEGLVMAETKLRENGVDVDNHPFFKDMKDSNKKAAFLDKVDKAFDKEVEEKTNYNRNHGGIKTEKE